VIQSDLEMWVVVFLSAYPTPITSLAPKVLPLDPPTHPSRSHRDAVSFIKPLNKGTTGKAEFRTKDWT
jgi:hypothetical protein